MSKGVNAVANNIDYCLDVTPKQFVQTANSGTPTVFTPVVTTDKYFRKAIIIGAKDLAATGNTSAVKIGLSIAASSQPLSIATGTNYTIEAPVGSRMRFDAWFFVTGTTGDGIVVIYW